MIDLVAQDALTAAIWDRLLMHGAILSSRRPAEVRASGAPLALPFDAA